MAHPTTHTGIPMDISNISLPELKDLLAQIPKEIERRQKDERTKLLKEMEALAAEHGFQLEELIGAGGIKKERTAVATKYRHPSNPELAWTGRGRQPKWVAEFQSNGGTLEQLKV